jgi:hypothetical protein
MGNATRKSSTPHGKRNSEKRAERRAAHLGIDEMEQELQRVAAPEAAVDPRAIGEPENDGCQSSCLSARLWLGRHGCLGLQ